MRPIALVLVAACGTSRLPVPDFPPPPQGAAGTHRNDPAREDLATVVVECQRLARSLESELRSERRIDRLMKALAYLVSVAAYAATSEDTSALTTNNAGDRDCYPGEATARCTPQGPTLALDNRPWDADPYERPAASSPGATIAAALEHVDVALGSESSSRWSHEAWQTWDRALDGLRRACGLPSLEREETRTMRPWETGPRSVTSSSTTTPRPSNANQ
ncbi:MAG: hypothetical protein AAGE52_33875 [Myxococcota bacterium]